MKVFFVKFYLNDEFLTGVVQGVSEGEVFYKILTRFKDKPGLLLVLNDIVELDKPYFYIHSKGIEP